MQYLHPNSTFPGILETPSSVGSLCNTHLNPSDPYPSLPSVACFIPNVIQFPRSESFSALLALEGTICFRILLFSCLLSCFQSRGVLVVILFHTDRTFGVSTPKLAGDISTIDKLLSILRCEIGRLECAH